MSKCTVFQLKKTNWNLRQRERQIENITERTGLKINEAVRITEDRLRWDNVLLNDSHGWLVYRQRKFDTDPSLLLSPSSVESGLTAKHCSSGVLSLYNRYTQCPWLSQVSKYPLYHIFPYPSFMLPYSRPQSPNTCIPHPYSRHSPFHLFHISPFPSPECVRVFFWGLVTLWIGLDHWGLLWMTDLMYRLNARLSPILRYSPVCLPKTVRYTFIFPLVPLQHGCFPYVACRYPRWACQVSPSWRIYTIRWRSAARPAWTLDRRRVFSLVCPDCDCETATAFCRQLDVFTARKKKQASKKVSK